MNGEILLKAHGLINLERQWEYGEPKKNFDRVAALWSAYLDREITGHDVACLMALLKLARQANRHKADNLLDAAGYIGLAADMAHNDGLYIGLERGE